MSRGLLLDSHAFLWAASEPERLTPKVRDLLENETSKLHLSAATVWELPIKARKKKIDLGGDPATKLREYCRRFAHHPGSRFSTAPVSGI